ncbi:MAG: hypothetical protein RL594_242 [Bacteroidota bacterium]
MVSGYRVEPNAVVEGNTTMLDRDDPGNLAVVRA